MEGPTVSYDENGNKITTAYLYRTRGIKIVISENKNRTKTTTHSDREGIKKKCIEEYPNGCITTTVFREDGGEDTEHSVWTNGSEVMLYYRPDGSEEKTEFYRKAVGKKEESKELFWVRRYVKPPFLGPVLKLVFCPSHRFNYKVYA